MDGACAAPSSCDAKAAKLEEAQQHIEDEDTVGTEVGTDAPTLISRCQILTGAQIYLWLFGFAKPDLGRGLR